MKRSVLTIKLDRLLCDEEINRLGYVIEHELFIDRQNIEVTQIVEEVAPAENTNEVQYSDNEDSFFYKKSNTLFLIILGILLLGFLIYFEQYGIAVLSGVIYLLWMFTCSLIRVGDKESKGQ